MKGDTLSELLTTVKGRWEFSQASHGNSCITLLEDDYSNVRWFEDKDPLVAVARAVAWQKESQ